MDHDDFDFEPEKGLPAVLPEGEKLIWQGKPEAWGIAVRAFHLRKVAVYFAALMVWRFYSAMSGGQTFGDALGYAAALLPVACVPLAILGVIAWAYSRTTVYSVTNRRVVIRSGVALPITLNLPLSRIASASLKVFADGSGDIPLVPQEGERIAALVVWPHIRPWSLTNPVPMLRSVKDGEKVATILGAALSGQEFDREKIAIRKSPGGTTKEHVPMGNAVHA